MIALLRRLLRFAGSQKKALLAAFAFSFLDSLFALLPILAVLTVLAGLQAGSMPLSTVWVSLGLMVLSIGGRIVCGGLSSSRRTLGSFAICSAKRLQIGERLKRAPMGYFSQNRLGEITAAVTTTLGDVEINAVAVLDKLFNGFIHAAVITLWLLIYEWRVGLITLLGIGVALLVYAQMQKAAKRLSAPRQAAQAGLVTAVLEYVQGMGVVKAFGLGERSGRAVDQAIAASAAANIRLEQAFSALTGVYQTVFKLAAAFILVLAPYLLLVGQLDLTKCLLLLISSFLIYAQVELVGSMAALARVIEASLDRLESVLAMPLLDEKSTALLPQSLDIELRDVGFAYGEKDVIRGVSLRIPEKTSCAIVGPSGAGKTTLCRLIARFWDAQSGQVLVGGRDVRDYSCDSLLANFAIVFQQVYLFQDSIENNIKFGRPEAPPEEVMAAARRACCHDFIMALPAGYQTLVGEGGASLSGGERQRISLARAILKDAPIIILDEATASVDPENERELQAAIAELCRDKTVLMIAHRLASVRHADQILVLDAGRVVQRGTHQELLAQDGLYRRFVNLREQALGWRLTREGEAPTPTQRAVSRHQRQEAR